MMVSVYIEGREYIIENSKNVLEACLSLGFDIPYFCWHPALGSIGSCRQCAVKWYRNNNKSDSLSDGKLVMACMTPIVEDMNIVLFEKEVKEFRKNILELLMINHPHDCPVCEEGGNCHLQDMTVMTGHTYRSYRFTKRTHRNQYLGPLIAHEMNRCITCYRCVRYYKDYAGGSDLGVFGVHDNIYFGRVCDGMLQSEFSGNLIEICPTGVFTDKTRLKNYTRKWDTVFAPSICQQCSVGCNIIIGERYGKLCRVENRYNGSINGYFLCDRGRFGCDYINLDDRPKKPLKRENDDKCIYINQLDALYYVVNLLKGSSKVIGVGSTRASIESNFALRKLVGPNNFYNGITSLEQELLSLILRILCNSGIHIPSVREIEDYDAILILGEDLTQTAPRVALSVRQAIKKKSYQMAGSKGIFDWQSIAVSNIAQNSKYPLFITSLDETKLDDLAELIYCDSVQNQARFGFAVAHSLDSTAPSVENFDSKLNEKLDLVVQALLNSNKPLIISGSSSGSKELIESASNIAKALKNQSKEVGIVFVVNDSNSIGLSMINNKSFDEAINLLCSNNISTISIVVLENDLYRYLESSIVDKVLNNISCLIVLDHQYNVIQKKANVVLPTTSFAESNGTVINYEGRAQRFFKLYSPGYYDNDIVMLEGWRWLYLIHDMLYINSRSQHENLSIDNVIDAIVHDFPELSGIKDAAPNSDFRIHGQKIAQTTHRYSGRSAMNIDINNVHEACIFQNQETMFTSVSGNYSNKSLHKQVAFAWSPGWNSPQAWNKFQDRVGGSLYPSDPGVRLLGSVSCNNKKDVSVGWFDTIPDAFEINDSFENKWLIAPYWHLFGSEDMSQRSEYVKCCMVNPYVMLNSSDAVRLSVQKNMFLKFTCADQTMCLPVKFSVNLPTRHIGLPIGFPGIPMFFIGMYAKNVQGVFD